MKNDYGYGPAVAMDGHVLQSGVYTPSVEDRLSAGVWGAMIRAVVLATYYADDSEWKGWSGGGVNRMIACDVRTYGRRSRVLKRVPVLQPRHGLWDDDLWAPRPARQNITGGNLLIATNSSGDRPTLAEDMDGDHVIVGFMENDPAQPVILPFTMGHPRSRQKIVKADGQCRRIRVNGTLIEWDKQGNLILDATSAAKEELGPQGTEQSNSGTGGQILIKTKDGTGKVLRLLLDADGDLWLEAAGATEALNLTKGSKAEIKATTTVHLNAPMTNLSDVSPEPVIKGTTFNAAFSPALQGQKTMSQEQVTAYSTLIAACSAPPLSSLVPGFQALMASATAFGQSVDQIVGLMAGWLSAKVKTG